jgi:hypothetical protein
VRASHPNSTLSAHDRASDWRRRGHSELAVAAIYADERSRMLIERQLRVQFCPIDTGKFVTRC